MSESTSSVNYEDVSLSEDPHVKKDILKRKSVLNEADVHALVVTFKIPEDLHPRVPLKDMTMNQLPADAIGLYAEYFFEGGLTVPFTNFLLDVIRYFKVHIPQLVPLGMHRVTLFEVYCRSMHIPPTTPLFRVFYKLSKQGCWFSFEKRAHADRKVCFKDFPSCLKGWKHQFFLIDRRAIPFAMPWRHQDSDVSDPFPKNEYNIAHAEMLAETPIEPLQVPQGILYALGLSDHWEFPGYRPALRDEEGRGVTMSEYLKKPLLRKKVNVEKGDKYPEGHVSAVHVTRPLESNAQVPEKTDELRKVEVPDNKVLAAKDRKKEQATKAGLKKPPSKRSGGNISSRVQKRTKVTDDTPVIDLDVAGDIPEPRPIRSIPPKDSGVEGTGDQAGGSGAVHHFVFSSGSKGGSSRPGKEAMVEEEGIGEDASDAPYVPEWSVKRGTRMNNANVCRDMMINLATPEEESYLDLFKDGEAIQRAWLSLGKHATAQADVIFRFESLLVDHRKLTATHQTCENTLADYRKRFDGMAADLKKARDEHAECSNKDPEEFKKLRLEHAGCSERELSLTGRVSDLEKEKDEWRKVSAEQAEKIKALEAELGKVKLALSEEEEEYKKLLQEKQDIAIRAGNAEIDRNRVVNEFLPEMVRHLLGSHEFKTTLAEPFNLFYQSGLIDGANLGNEPEEAVKLLEAAVEGIDLDADQKYQVLFDQALTKDYPYVQKVSKTRFRSFNDLMDMFPDAAPTEPVVNVTGTSGTDSDGQVVKEGPTVENPSDQDNAAPSAPAPIS
ncbi:transposase (putative), gypsy type [Artemisia annua]|uniref:Transposase (Putative), gypsy type n=1 Tax=Artemisia annua TaxID=35608 RepID=A0A2U1MXG5_ARTAN|nr:transposase (putative), gypsy type [Artemisia annua]